MIGGVLGAKIYVLLDHVHDLLAEPLQMIFSGSGLTWYGGLIGGAVGALLVARWRAVGALRLCDIAAPLLSLGYAIGRVGCFLNGDDYGRPSGVPWAMAFPKGMPPTLVRVHPTQLYEVAAGLLMFLLLTGLKSRVTRAGALFGLYLVLAGMERFLVEFVRNNDPGWLGLTVAQWFSLALIAGGGWLYGSRGPREPVSTSA
jgi:phosphatidylglycerol:prolipoprotein diacylglycerol transferase